MAFSSTHSHIRITKRHKAMKFTFSAQHYYVPGLDYNFINTSESFHKTKRRVSQVTQRQKMKLSLERFFSTARAADSAIQQRGLVRFATHFHRGGQLTCWRASIYLALS
jgi:hypothetical protein